MKEKGYHIEKGTLRFVVEPEFMRSVSVGEILPGDVITIKDVIAPDELQPLVYMHVSEIGPTGLAGETYEHHNLGGVAKFGGYVIDGLHTLQRVAPTIADKVIKYYREKIFTHSEDHSELVRIIENKEKIVEGVK